MRFDELNLISPLLSALTASGYETPTPVQAASIPHILEGKDLLGCAQTGTGKTAAFALPILQKLSAHPPVGHKPVRALVLSPTRELAVQIHESFETYGKHLSINSTTVFGGVGESPQKAALRRGVDVVIATPGRLLDLLGQRALSLDKLEFLVLDEADRMLDMGFVTDVRKICQYVPARRQTLLFSATMPNEIRKLADSLLRNPVSVEVARVSSTAEKIDQGVYHVPRDSKPLLLRTILSQDEFKRVIVFTRTKHGADRVSQTLSRYRIPSEAIHGNKSQNARQRALNNFKEGRLRVLVATDLASRGIDVDDISHVINYDIPIDSESYVHRIGRTARAGASGISLSFCAPEDRGALRDIEKLIRQSVRVIPTPALDDSRVLPALNPTAAASEDAGNEGGERDRRNPRGRRTGHDRSSDRNGQERSRHGHPARSDADRSRIAQSDRSQPKAYLEGGRGEGNPNHQGGSNRPGKFGKRHGKSSSNRGGSVKREYFSNGR